MKTYIDWAVGQGFAVMDVNLPKHVTDYEGNDTEYKETHSPEYRTREATKLLTYLWTNYIELYESEDIILMGTNIGHGAIVHFLRNNGDDKTTRLIKQAVSFIGDTPLLSVKSPTNDNLVQWYWENSRVFVSCEHGYWAQDLGNKKRKRFGDVTQSPCTTISEMLAEHKDTVLEAIQEAIPNWDPSKVETSEDDMEMLPEPARMPPVGNFALSPSKALATPSGARFPPGNGSRSPPKLPPLQNFAPSPKR